MKDKTTIRKVGEQWVAVRVGYGFSAWSVATYDSFPELVARLGRISAGSSIDLERRFTYAHETSSMDIAVKGHHEAF